MFDMNNMMGKIQEVQENMKKAQANLVNITHTAEAGGDMVKVTVNGNKQLIKLDVDDALLNPNDKVMLQDLIIAATNKAIEDIEPKVKEEMQKSTGSILPIIPGFDLSNFMK